jgi:rare lipoprotein A
MHLHCNKARKERILKHHHTTHRRFVKSAALTGALAFVFAAGLEIRPTLARSHSSEARHAGLHRVHLHHGGTHVAFRDGNVHESMHNLGMRHARIHEARAHHGGGHGVRHGGPSESLAHSEHGYEGSGLASVYSDGRTASGEHMNPGAMTAAHRTLPFGTMVTVVNSRNGRSVTVRINDRGPFVHGRVIDLSPAAARVIGVDGLARVSLIVGRGA